MRRVIPNSTNSDNQNPFQSQLYQVYAESKTFYKNLKYSFSSDQILQNRSQDPYLENPDRKFYRNQTQIPNNLKRNTWERSMIIQRVWSKNGTKLHGLLQSTYFDNFATILLHITSNDVNLILEVDRNTETIPLKIYQTYILFIPEMIKLKMALETNTIPFIIGVELILKHQYNPYPSYDLDECIPIDKNAWNSFSSFTLTPLVNNAHQLVILSTKFVYEYNGTPQLAEITILDYLGMPMMNTLVCPRTQIINYGPAIGGMNATLLTNKMDQWIAYVRLQELLCGKIIVGLQVAKQIMRLRIDSKNVRGIRDMATASVCEERVTISKPWSLNDIASVYNDQVNARTTLEMAGIIYRIYMKVEPTWKDDIAPWKMDMSKVPWDIVNKHAIHYYPTVYRAKITHKATVKKRVDIKEIVPAIKESKEGENELNIEDTRSVQIQQEDSDSGNEIWLDPMVEENI